MFGKISKEVNEITEAPLTCTLCRVGLRADTQIVLTHNAAV